MSHHYRIEISDDLDATVNGLAWAMGCSRDEVWSKAVALLECCVKANQTGHKILICEKDGTRVKGIVGIVPGDNS